MIMETGFYVCMCVNLFTCECVICMCVYMIDQTSTSSVFHNCSSPYLLKQCLLLNTRFTNFQTSSPESSRNPPVSTPPVPELQTCAITRSLCVFQESDFRPPALTVHAFSTAPSPQPHSRKGLTVVDRPGKISNSCPQANLLPQPPMQLGLQERMPDNGHRAAIS